MLKYSQEQHVMKKIGIVFGQHFERMSVKLLNQKEKKIRIRYLLYMKTKSENANKNK